MWARIDDRVLWTVALVPALALCVKFWSQRSLDALTVPSLLVDRMLQIAVLALVTVLLVAVMLWRRAGRAAWLWFAGSVVGIMLSVTTLFAGGLNGPADPVAIGLALAAFLGSLWVLLRVMRILPGLRASLAKRSSVVAGTLLAAALPWMQFWHSTFFLPDRTEANLTQNIGVTYEGSRAGRSLATVTYEARNDTDARVFVILSRLDVCSRAEGTAANALGGFPRACRSQIATPINQRSWISAKSTLTYRVAIEAPESEPVLTIRATIAYARGDRMREVGSEAERKLPDHWNCSDITMVELQEASHYEALAEQKKYLVYYTVPSGGPEYYVAPENRAALCPHGADAGLAAHYGVTESTVVWEGRPALPSRMPIRSDPRASRCPGRAGIPRRRSARCRRGGPVPTRRG